ncbi:hypothetical protein GWQ43_19955 (plasmid) [Alcaligenes faecalis]|nr:hypothetical protein [Alcaligenes faecalis]QHS38444.1 hypothetical protein GWQ43_19955 [Alcaligenes faecalis]
MKQTQELTDFSSQLSTDSVRKLSILCMIAKHPMISSTSLSRYTKIPDPSLKRHIQQLRRGYFVDIIYVRMSQTEAGIHGGYEIRDWGIIDKDELLRRYGHMVPDKIEDPPAIWPSAPAKSKRKSALKSIATDKVTKTVPAAKKAAAKRAAAKKAIPVK